MKTSVEVRSKFNCSLERAFKTPILGDATKYLVGYGPIPAVVGFVEDETWGTEGGSRVPLSAKGFASKGGEVGFDQIAIRDENKHWKWGVTDFRQPSLGFTSFQGEFFVKDNGDGSIAARWSYTLHSKGVLAYPFHWLVTKVFWKGQMKRGIKNMKKYAESEAQLLYS